MTPRAPDVMRYLDMGSAALDFARIERIPYHQDAKRRETDSDHTVMLGWIACAFASAHYLDWLDLGLVAQFALVHDAVELYAGDTNTLRITPLQMEEKKKREREAVEMIRQRFEPRRYRTGEDWFSWAIFQYEGAGKRIFAEARFVKGMDKLMPKITHIHNRGQVFLVQKMKRRELEERYDRQYHEMMKYCQDFPELMEFRKRLVALVFETCAEVLA